MLYYILQSMEYQRPLNIDILYSTIININDRGTKTMCGS